MCSSLHGWCCGLKRLLWSAGTPQSWCAAKLELSGNKGPREHKLPFFQPTSWKPHSSFKCSEAYFRYMGLLMSNAQSAVLAGNVDGKKTDLKRVTNMECSGPLRWGGLALAACSMCKWCNARKVAENPTDIVSADLIRAGRNQSFWGAIWLMRLVRQKNMCLFSAPVYTVVGIRLQKFCLCTFCCLKWYGNGTTFFCLFALSFEDDSSLLLRIFSLQYVYLCCLWLTSNEIFLLQKINGMPLVTAML